jgi:hypothetical protein
MKEYRMNRLYALAIGGCLAGALGGCASGQLPSPVAPTIAQIGTQAAALQGSPLVNDPAAYTAVGYTLSDAACGAYFDALTMNADKLQFARAETNLLGGAAVGIMSAVGAGAGPLGIAGSAVPLMIGSIDNYQAMTAAGAYPDETAGLVQSAQHTYLSAAPAPGTVYDADALVQGYARLCSYAGIHQLARQAISKATTVAIPVQAAATLGARMTPPRAQVPYIVVR